MINKTFTVIIILIFSSLLYSAQITVVVENIKKDEGKVFVGLFKPDEDFPKREKRLKGGPVIPKNQKVSMTFTDVTSGEYAISTHHDINSNDAVDKNFMGMPKEPYGFSNNQYGPFGKPDHKKSTIIVKADDTLTVKIKLR